MYRKRTYRRIAKPSGMVSFRVTVRETDLMIYAPASLIEEARESVLLWRGHLESYIAHHPLFKETLAPWNLFGPAPAIVSTMASASAAVGVGPMAAVAGALAEAVGRDLLAKTSEVMVENGGDIFLKLDRPVTIALFAGRSPLSMRMGLRVDNRGKPCGVCTSSGTVGHSLSLGNADAVCILADNCALADAAATAIGNRVQSQRDIAAAVDECKHIEGVSGVVIIYGDKIGAWGQVELVALSGRERTAQGS